MKKLKKNLSTVREKLIRFNQAVLSLPVWMVVGFAGFLRHQNSETGWKKSEKNENYEKMY